MPYYSIPVHQTITAHVVVEADDEDQAMEKALDVTPTVPWIAGWEEDGDVYISCEAGDVSSSTKEEYDNYQAGDYFNSF